MVGAVDEFRGGSNVEWTTPMKLADWRVRYFTEEPRITTSAPTERTFKSLPKGPASGGGVLRQSK
jgi:hypothetical protein